MVCFVCLTYFGYLLMNFWLIKTLIDQEHGLPQVARKPLVATGCHHMFSRLVDMGCHDMLPRLVFTGDHDDRLRDHRDRVEGDSNI